MIQHVDAMPKAKHPVESITELIMACRASFVRLKLGGIWFASNSFGMYLRACTACLQYNDAAMVNAPVRPTASICL